MNVHVNWLIKVNVNVEVFFFTTNDIATNQLWLISRRFVWSAAVNFPFLTTFPYPTPLNQIMV